MGKNIPKNLEKAPKNLIFAVLAADVVLWTIKDKELLVRVIPVHIPPHFIDKQGLPGGLIQPTETAEQAAKRLLKAKAGVSADKVYLEQLYTFSGVKRDPRGRVVAVAYTGIVPWEHLSSGEQENSVQAQWVNVKRLPQLAYDHKDIIAMALSRLQGRVTYTNIIAHFMPKEFTLTELEETYELILDKDIDKRNFRKKILALKLLKELPKERRGQKHRPAKLYAFRSLNHQIIEVL